MLLHHVGNRSWGDVNHIFGNDERLYVQCISCTYTTPGNAETRLERERYFLHFVSEGSVLYDGVPAKEGDVYLMEPGSVHRLKCISDVPLLQFCIEFHGTEAAKLCRSAGLSNTSRHTVTNPQKMRNILHEAVYETGSMSDSSLVQMSLGLLYYFISQTVSPDADPIRTEQTGYVRRAAEFIRENYMYPISARDAASSVGLTEKYLCRLFRRELDVTPTEYLCACRERRALELLSVTELSVYEISQMVGITDSTYFSRFIKARTGKSPSWHRKQ